MFDILVSRQRLFSGARLIAVILPVAALCACASNPISSCMKIAGDAWAVLPAPPPNAQTLLSLEGLSSDASPVWMSRDADDVLACFYAGSLVHRDCSGSMAYVFQRKGSHWESNGVLLDACGRYDED